jgi:hypothetical protein
VARERLPREYEAAPDLESLGDEVRRGEMPIGRALAMLHRSTQLTAEVIDAICMDARKGYEWAAIAARIGVSKTMLANWMRRGEDRRNAVDEWVDRRRDLPADMPDDDVIAEIGEPPVEDDLLVLYDRVARAFADGECAMIDVIRDDALVNGNVSAAKWLLTARYPSWRDSSKNNVRITQTENSDVDVISAIEKKLIAHDQRMKALNGADA